LPSYRCLILFLTNFPILYVFRNPRHLGTWTSRYWTFRYWPGHLGTRYWTVRDLDETIFGTDHNCLVLINCQYVCTSSSLIYDSKVDRYVFLIIPV
jgi:hypothetical protein